MSLCHFLVFFHSYALILILTIKCTFTPYILTSTFTYEGSIPSLDFLKILNSQLLHIVLIWVSVM